MELKFITGIQINNIFKGNIQEFLRNNIPDKIWLEFTDLGFSGLNVTRLEILNSAFRVIINNPFFGTGAASFPIIYEYDDKYPIRDYCGYLTINDGKVERCCQPINSRIKRFNRPYCKEHATVKCYYCNSGNYVRHPFRPNFDFYYRSGDVLLCDKCGSCT